LKKLNILGCAAMGITRPSMTARSGYVLEFLREGGDFTLYRGRQNGNPSPVLAVALAAEQPSPQALRRLEHEFSLAADLDPAWAAKPLALTRHEGRTILVLKDPGGDPLDRILEQHQGQPLELTLFLRIAIGLATALGQVHRHGLIHKDIKPANVLVDDAGKVWLTGFGIASQLPRERQAPAPPEIIAGTLAYMAPEQTGRMNRSIDTRSDLYSLGATFYQMLTGHLPFAAADAMEWVHCHIARQPSPPDRIAKLPAPLSAMVMRLLAKTVEERYQTAVGLEADLRRCLAEWETQGHIDPFPLGTHDVSDRLLIPEKLYGRECEVNALLAAFDRVVTHGTLELVLVSGYSGVGKSSVVNELHKELVPPRGLFAAGKFDQYKRDIPYAILAQAFQTLVRQILVKSAAEVDQWRGALADAVGLSGQLIVDLIPEMEFIIGKQPPLPDLPPQDAQNRFQLVFRRLLGAFARPEHPLALFLDDLQWLDAATLDLLERLVTHPEVQHLLVVGAYRDNEVTSSHPLTGMLGAIRKAEAKIQEIVLAPLRVEDVDRLVTDALHCERDAAHPLAQLVHDKTGGNPFFAIQFCTALADEGLLWFDPVAQAWQWDMDRISAKSYTDNVVNLMAGKLKRFSANTQEALKHLACLGNVAEIAPLAMVQEETEEAIHAALWEAVRAGLILQHEGTYKFLHDRIQQAAYSLISEEHRAEVHLALGRALLAGMTPDQLGEHIFDMANQFSLGAAQLIDRDEQVQVATIDLRAGRKAKASAAYASACVYLATGMTLLDESDWRSQYELMFGLWLERAECEFLAGRFDQAESLIEELLRRAASKVDQAAVYHLKVLVHTVKSENMQAVDSALTCLRLFGIDLPAHPTFEHVHAEYESVWRTFDGRPTESLISLPMMTDPEVQAAMQMLSVLGPPAYFTDFHSFCLIACRMVKIAMQHGISDASALGFAILGFISGPVFHRYGEGCRFVKLACDLVEKHRFIANQPKVYHAAGTVAFWTQPIETAIDSMRAAFRTAMETGDLTFACYGMYQVVTGLLLRNDPLDAVWRESEVALDFARETKYGDAADIIRSQQRFVATMQGRTATFSNFSDAHFDEATFEAQLTGDRMASMICFYWILKLKARFLSGDYAEALAAADKVKPLLSAATAQIQLLDYFYYIALTVAALYENASADEQQGWRDLLTAHREQLGEWADNYPPTFGDKHALVSAELARIEGRDLDAMRLYEEAIGAARENGFAQNEALAHEVAARFYATQGFETIAYAYLRNARNCYERWGALSKVKQLDECYPQLHEERNPISPIATIGSSVGQLDVETVVTASQALSSEIVLPKLIEKLLRIAVEHAGAERGLLILLRGDEPQIEAEATTAHGSVEVTVRQAPVTPSDLPQSALHYVIRTRERVVLDDASVGTLYAEDEYVRQKHARSVLCLPIIKQTKLAGALYLENNLTPRAFTAERVAVLELMASQAAIALENASLYSDLQTSEGFLAQGQSLTHTGSFGLNAWNGEIYWSDETYKIFEFDRAAKPTLDWVLQRTHPEDRYLLQETLDRSLAIEMDFDFEHRLLMPDGAIKHVHALARVVKTSSGKRGFVGTVTDITEHKRTEEASRRSERYLAEAQRLARMGSWVWRVTGREAVYLSEEWYRIYGFDPEAGAPAWSERLQRVHPEDRAKWHETIDRAIDEKSDYEVEFRILLPDGTVKSIYTVGHPVMNARAEVTEFVGSSADITERKRAEEKIRQSERELRQVLDLSPQHIAEFGSDRDSTRLYINQAALDYFGSTLEEWRSGDRHRFFHPDDWARFRSEAQGNFLSGSPYEFETRLRRRDGQYRWFLFRHNPLRDEQGRVTRWYVAATDIEDRKQAEQQLQHENVALREELDKASMFEEIVGMSPRLQTVLSRVSKVAPTDSGVLITGETGTGKELVARAIHRRSRRASRAFVSVNCAAIPRDLIASELFGHEKGSFTGATQRRIGRFELAEGGTIFLDEVGELPAETQIALLRVLQEREFERVGGTGSIQIDVRVIAATNRDLEAAIAAGMFRSDLFYRLNVFPIEMPSLRERRDDIPLLVEYFIGRYARKAGKSFQTVNKRSFDLLQSYPWPGNIRELQNVIERSVIVCDTDNFSVDESWLSRKAIASGPTSQLELSQTLAAQEKQLIEAALRESGGRVSGPSGAATKLRMPGSTLESKIKSLNINKALFKTVDHSISRT
jgi:PAS domain S-box-containing protein